MPRAHTDGWASRAGGVHVAIGDPGHQADCNYPRHLGALQLRPRGAALRPVVYITKPAPGVAMMVPWAAMVCGDDGPRPELPIPWPMRPLILNGRKQAVSPKAL